MKGFRYKPVGSSSVTGRDHRSKPVGWRGESHRHYLAAKGIKTKYFMPKIPVEQFPLQRHVGAEKFDKEKFAQIKQNPVLSKPRGGFWTSSVDDEGQTQWDDFLKYNNAHGINADTSKTMNLRPKENARIFSILTDEDVRELYSKYGSVDAHGFVQLNWDAVAEDYDAINLSSTMAWGRRLNGVDVRDIVGDAINTDVSFSEWDGESTVWLNPDAIKQVDHDLYARKGQWKYEDDDELKYFKTRKDAIEYMESVLGARISRVSDGDEDIDEENYAKKIVQFPTDQAFEMRRKGSGIGSMEQKRTDQAMERLRNSMRTKGFTEPIPASQEEINEGRLQEGKHRIIVAKELGLKTVPVEVEY